MTHYLQDIQDKQDSADLKIMLKAFVGRRITNRKELIHAFYLTELQREERILELFKLCKTHKLVYQKPKEHVKLTKKGNKVLKTLLEDLLKTDDLQKLLNE